MYRVTSCKYAVRPFMVLRFHLWLNKPLLHRIGFPKKAEIFYFFQIKNDVQAFRTRLHKLVPLITSSEEVKSGRQRIINHRQNHPQPLPIAFTNIAFSSKGLKKVRHTLQYRSPKASNNQRALTNCLYPQLGLNAADAKDDGFTNGMLPDSKSLGDVGKLKSDGQTFDPNWTREFKNGDIDGVLLIAGGSHHSVEKALTEALTVFRDSVSEVLNMFGHVRPGKEDGHEHFGFEDGLSNPAVDGITTDLSTQGPVDQG